MFATIQYIILLTEKPINCLCKGSVIYILNKNTEAVPIATRFQVGELLVEFCM